MSYGGSDRERAWEGSGGAEEREAASRGEALRSVAAGKRGEHGSWDVQRLGGPTVHEVDFEKNFLQCVCTTRTSVCSSQNDQGSLVLSPQSYWKILGYNS